MGSEEQKRQAARDAREEGKSASEIGATTGGSQRRTEARPGSRDTNTLDHERFPRL